MRTGRANTDAAEAHTAQPTPVLEHDDSDRLMRLAFAFGEVNIACTYGCSRVATVIGFIL